MHGTDMNKSSRQMLDSACRLVCKDLLYLLHSIHGQRFSNLLMMEAKTVAETLYLGSETQTTQNANVVVPQHWG